MSEYQSIFILGASGGIGSALARALKSHGHQVILGGRDNEKLSSLGDELTAPHVIIDGSDFTSVNEGIDSAVSISGGIQGVVNCAGSSLLKPSHLTTESEWDAIIQSNLTTAFAIVRSGARVMMKTGGAIVLVSAVAGRFGLPYHDAIAAAKAGVIGLTQSAAATYAKRGIRINCVAPGLVRTPMTKSITSNDTQLQAAETLHPLGQIGEPRHIASAIEWLLDIDNSWITGQTLGIDGGLSTLSAVR
jgi:NAD(P)-dependent dehydrogenase (short-subunit alcohol dehydrogenase family)|tara:strand:- start:425 stop:1165 length:741 start_codon:yes stop_codon:yes gene_type:complete